jgi:predicted nuclease with TOPRIM domain
MEEIQKEVTQLIKKNVNPRSSEWQTIRNRIYEINQQRERTEKERFQKLQDQHKEKPFDVDEVSVVSANSSGSESSIYKHSKPASKTLLKPSSQSSKSVVRANSKKPVIQKARFGGV